MIRNLHFYKWFVAVIVLICSTITVSAQTKVTSVSQLKGGSVIKIYPKDNNGTSHYGENNYALACSGDGQSLTSYEEAGSGDEWTLEDAGDGYCYLKNDKGCYWTNQKRSYSESLICTLDKSSAVKICLTWDTKYSGVCFWNEKDDRGLNNLDGSNCRYNWCYDSGEFNFGDNITFYIALLKEGSGNDFVKGKVIETWVNKIKYYLDTRHKTAEIVSQYGHFSGDIVIPETITYDNVTYKVTSLGKACFLGSSSMTSISLPSGIISLGDYCFSGCSSLASISLPFGVTSLGDECFKGCSKFTSITLPSSITSLGGWCFEDCGNLKSILCLAVEPPRCYYKDVVDKTTSLYVPKESVEKYKQSAAWNSAYGIYPLYPASSISLVKEISVIKTKSTKLEYTIMPENAGTKELEWSSEDPEVATVDANGMVTGKKVGKVAITAITKDGTGIIASSSINVIPLMVSDFSLQTTSAMRTIATQLDTNITPSEADNKKLKWSSLTPDIAIVTEDGVLTGLKVGTAKVKAETTDGSKLSKTFNVEVKTLPVGSITLPSTPVSVVKTKTGKIKVTIEPLAADNQKLIWTSSRPDIATVDNEGVVTGKKVGTTRITASTTDGTNLKASVDVNIQPLKVETMTFAEPSVSIVKTEDKTIKLTLNSEEVDNKSMVWTSSDESVATVVQNMNAVYPLEAIVVAHKVGKATIKAEAQDGSGMSATCEVEVTPLMVSDFSLQTASVVKTIPTQLEANFTPAEADNKKLKWTSLTPDIATVTEDGMMTGLKMGTAKVKAETTDGSNLSNIFEVQVMALLVSTISLPAESSIVKTESMKLEYSILPLALANQKLKWSSNATYIASVDESTGVITAHKVGDAIITATATDGSGISASTKIHVTPLKVSNIELSNETMDVLWSTTETLTATVSSELADNKTLKWTSDNEDIATVTQEGVVKGLKVGNANITVMATDGSGVSATCKVTVKPVVIDLSTKTINLRKGESYAEQIVNVLPENYEHKEVLWASTDNSIASINSDGVITAVKPGITTIKYKLGFDSNITAECKVIVYDENVVYVGGIYYIIDKQKSEATVTSIYGGKNTSLDAEQVAQCYSGTINIPESIIYEGYKYSVTKVGSYAFNCQNELQSIYIPRTVKEVEPYAAIKAEKLNRVNVADESQLENIGEQAFKLCIGLKRFVFDGTSLQLNTIGNAAFNGCTALEKVLWNGKSELKTIKDYAFFKCTSLNNFDMPNTTLSVGNSSFRYNASLTDIHLSTSLNYIDEYAFGECGFSHITLPESLANIQAGAFINNEHLQDITLPERLQGLGSAAFENNSALESVTFHTALETMTIGNNAFNLCPVLSKVFITNMKSFAQTNFNNAKANPANTSQHIYNADGEEIINVVLPKGTKYVNNNAFNGCAYIQSIKMPATMDHINDDIFVGCSALKDVYCYAEEVPEFIGVNDPSAMNDVFANATLHVVFGHEQAYKADAWWKRFSNVEGCDAPSDDEVTSVVLNQTELTMKPDDTIQLTATVYPTNATNKKLIWTSSNGDVAMVTDDGFVLVMAEGEVDITVTSAENSSIKAVCHIKVEKEKVPVITIVGIKFEESPVTISMGETKKLNVIFNPIDATNKQLEWKSTKTSVVDVDQEGNIIGVSEGKAIITAKTTDGSNLTINCVVTVVPATGINDITIGNVKLIVENRRLKVEGLAENDIIQVVDYAGSTIYRGTDHEVYLNTSGVYIVKVKGKTMKIHVK